ncbi:hypothetical protein LTR53_010725 [Teratosphaeriaceae sp. CCFEE 6253]|nr:hypothetical protein LTR53_010725 [Teratosphaeriaceae sp. CCFEE 6253]
MINRQPVPTAYYQHPYLQHAAHGQYHDPSVGYRPLQLPLQYHQQQPAAEQQLSLVASGFHTPGFRPHQQQHLQPQALPVRTRQQIRRQVMAYEGQSEDDLADLQKLSNEYEPEVTGPLVGPREPSTNIAAEYASADPVYQAKTAALPQKYSHYRTTRGDGKCGWRAIGFGYFESLIHLGDTNKFLEEETRLRSLSNVLNAAGFQPFLYDDFADEAFDLLRKVASVMHAGSAHDVLYEAFNDDMMQNYIITYFKVCLTDDCSRESAC